MGAAAAHRQNSALQTIGLMIILAALGLMMGSSTRASYSDAVDSSNNQLAAGSVALGDDDSGNLMLSLNDAKPGASTQACISVTYSGSLPASVRLFGQTSGTGLDPYLRLVVTRGSFTSPAPQFASCTNFVADGTDHIGKGSGVIYDGTLADFPDTYAGAIVDPTAGASAQWASGESHVYKLTVTLQDNSAAEGKTAGQTFTWEARNV